MDTALSCPRLNRHCYQVRFHVCLIFNFNLLKFKFISPDTSGGGGGGVGDYAVPMPRSQHLIGSSNRATTLSGSCRPVASPTVPKRQLSKQNRSGSVGVGLGSNNSNSNSSSSRNGRNRRKSSSTSSSNKRLAQHHNNLQDKSSCSSPSSTMSSSTDAAKMAMAPHKVCLPNTDLHLQKEAVGGCVRASQQK